MRFFIALDIPEEDKDQIRSVQEKIKKIVPQIRLTDPEKLHLTLAFIGEQPDIYKDKFIELIKRSGLSITPFTITPAYLDGFPHLHSAHILWLGVKGDTDKLYQLKHHIKDGLINMHVSVDPRRYVPHIAIGKLKDFKLTPGIEKRFEEIMTTSLNPITIFSVKLFESIPSHGFHSHNTLAEIKLSKNNV